MPEQRPSHDQGRSEFLRNRSHGDKDATAAASLSHVVPCVDDFDVQVTQEFDATVVANSNSLTDIVFPFYASRVSDLFVVGLRNLISVAEQAGYSTNIQFFRCNNMSETPPIAMTFERMAGGTTVHGIPNVASILNKPEERLRGDSDHPGAKLTRASDGTAFEGEDSSFGERVQFEEFASPARILITESTDPTGHRPFDLAVQLSSDAAHQAEIDLEDALDREAVGKGQESFSVLLEDVVHPLLTETLSRYSARFGLRERAELLGAELDYQTHRIRLQVKNPNEDATEDLPVEMVLAFNPIASARLVGIG